MYRTIKGITVHIIDCSHPLSESIPVWPGDPPVRIRPCADIEQGFQMNSLFIAEHSGTHLGVPSHYLVTGYTLDQLPVSDLVRPAICIHATHYPEFFKRFRLTADTVQKWEKDNDVIPNDCIVIVHTGWDKYWDFHYMGTGDRPMLPGIAQNAAELFVERKVRGIGIDSPDVGGGEADFAVNRFLAGHNIFHLENLTRLDELSEKGFTLVIGAVSVKGGSGIPCRVLAVLTLA